MSDRGPEGDKTVRHGITLLTDQDVYLFKEGTHFKLYEKLVVAVGHTCFSGDYSCLSLFQNPRGENFFQ